MVRYTLFRIFIFICFLFIGVLVVAGFDVWYGSIKKQHIIDNDDIYLNYNKEELSRLAGNFLRSEGPTREFYQGEVEAALRDLVEGPSIIVAAELEDQGGEISHSLRNEEKLHAYNRFPNALFFKKFDPLYKGGVGYKDSEGEERRAVIRIQYTTPQQNAYIQKLTKRFALYALLSFLFILIGYLLLDRFFLRPYGAVVRSIGDHTERPPVIRPATSRLEKSYNDLARETLIRLVERHYLGSEQNQRYESTAQALHELPDLAIPHLGYSWMLVVSQREGGTEEPAFCYWALTPDAGAAPSKSEDSSGGVQADRPPSGIGLPIYKGEALLADDSLKEIDTLCSPGGGASGVATYLLLSNALKPKACLVTKLRDIDEPETTHYLFAGAPEGVVLDDDVWEAATYKLLGERMQEILQRLAQQRDALASERRMANVALARNLGHDLTNVIATSKLDLMTLRRLAEKEENIAGKKLTILRGSLDNLFNNTRFMQAIVDLYRSFSYLQKPSYSEENIAEILQETTEIFQISSSFDFDLKLDLPEKLPTVTVEARLLKLAVFNLLNNSLDALKQENREEETLNPSDTSPALSGKKGAAEKGRPEKARIEVSVKKAPNVGEGIIVTVQDNGPGIRQADGRRLTREELPHIFELGYTTKSEGEGEGLGLNWVRTIITDFHGGKIRADNLDPRGAQFEITLPLRPPEEIISGESFTQ